MSNIDHVIEEGCELPCSLLELHSALSLILSLEP